MMQHHWQPRRSLFFIEAELRRMRRTRIRLLRQRLPAIPAGQYADQAVALMAEAIQQDPIPQPTDWAARALGLDTHTAPDEGVDA